MYLKKSIQWIIYLKEKNICLWKILIRIEYLQRISNPFQCCNYFLTYKVLLVISSWWSLLLRRNALIFLNRIRNECFDLSLKDLVLSRIWTPCIKGYILNKSSRWLDYLIFKELAVKCPSDEDNVYKVITLQLSHFETSHIV